MPIHKTLAEKPVIKPLNAILRLSSYKGSIQLWLYLGYTVNWEKQDGAKCTAYLGWRV